MYLSDCVRHKKGRQDLGLLPPEYPEAEISDSQVVSGCVHQGCVVQAAIPVCLVDINLRLHLED